MAVHAIHLATLDAANLEPGVTEITVEGDEAKHALKSKRLSPGEEVVIFNGRGHRALAEVTEAGRTLVVRVGACEAVPPVRPAVSVWSPPPKGPRLGDLINGLSQVGAAAWVPLITTRAGKGLTAAKAARMHRVAVEAAKQCGRSWLLGVSDPIEWKDALARLSASQGAGGRVLLAEPAATPFEGRGAPTVDILIGPEGGFTQEERRDAVDAGAEPCAFGPHVMRMELAGPVIAAMALDAERRLARSEHRGGR